MTSTKAPCGREVDFGAPIPLIDDGDGEVGDGEVGDGEVGDGEVDDGEVGDGGRDEFGRMVVIASSPV